MSVLHTQIVVHVEGLEMARSTVPLGDYVIGSADDADIVVECEGVSPRHALLTVNYSEWLIESLDFQGALFVNGRPVGK